MREQIALAPAIVATGFGAVHLPDVDTAVIADLHIGYARAARRRGGYLPSAEPVEMIIARTLDMLTALGATQLVIAGDLRHSTRDADDAERAEVAQFIRAVSAAVSVVFIAGNHDQGSDAPRVIQLGDVAITHEPPRTMPDQWTICGHLHPSTTIRDETGAGAKYPCFLVADRVCILPAFTEWAGGTEGFRLRSDLPDATWRRILVSDGTLYEL
jgi:uncharacterized protein